MEVESVVDIAERAALAPLKVPAKVKNTNVDRNNQPSTVVNAVQQQLPDSGSRETKPIGEHDSSPSRGKLLVAREFFWDDWLSYIATAILALALIDISVEFLVGSSLGVLCFAPFLNDTSQDFDSRPKCIYQQLVFKAATLH